MNQKLTGLEQRFTILSLHDKMVIGLAELKSTEYVVSIVDLNYLELDVLGMFLACSWHVGLPHFASFCLHGFGVRSRIFHRNFADRSSVVSECFR